MKTSSLMMCALVALTACGTGVKQSVRTPVEMGERIELKTPDPKMGLTINEALAARSSSRDFSPEMLSLEELSGVRLQKIFGPFLGAGVYCGLLPG